MCFMLDKLCCFATLYHSKGTLTDSKSIIGNHYKLVRFLFFFLLLFLFICLFMFFFVCLFVCLFVCENKENTNLECCCSKFL